MNKELKRIVKDAKNRGWIVEGRSSGHTQFKLPGGGIVVGSKSPSCPHAYKNLENDLRREENKNA
jgi:hypothetical protein